jgi:hypothetical protein
MGWIFFWRALSTKNNPALALQWSFLFSFDLPNTIFLNCKATPVTLVVKPPLILLMSNCFFSFYLPFILTRNSPSFADDLISVCFLTVFLLLYSSCALFLIVHFDMGTFIAQGSDSSISNYEWLFAALSISVNVLVTYPLPLIFFLVCLVSVSLFYMLTLSVNGLNCGEWLCLIILYFCEENSAKLMGPISFRLIFESVS